MSQENELSTSGKWNIALAIVCVVLFVCMILACRTCSLQRAAKINAQNNITVLQDSVHRVVLDNGQLLASRTSLVADNLALGDSLIITKRQLRDLEKKLDSDVREIVRVETRITHDTVVVTSADVVRVDSSYHVSLADSSRFTTFAATYDFILDERGDVTRDTFAITRNETRTTLTCGFDDDNKFFVTSSNPDIVFDDIVSAVKPERKKHFTLNAGVGIGAGYDIIHKDVFVGPYIGIGLSYTIFGF